MLRGLAAVDGREQSLFLAHLRRYGSAHTSGPSPRSSFADPRQNAGAHISTPQVPLAPFPESDIFRRQMTAERLFLHLQPNRWRVEIHQNKWRPHNGSVG